MHEQNEHIWSNYLIALMLLEFKLKQLEENEKYKSQRIFGNNNGK